MATGFSNKVPAQTSDGKRSSLPKELAFGFRFSSFAPLGYAWQIVPEIVWFGSFGDILETYPILPQFSTRT